MPRPNASTRPPGDQAGLVSIVPSRRRRTRMCVPSGRMSETFSLAIAQ